MEENAMIPRSRSERDAFRDRAIEILKGREIKKGTLVGCMEDEFVWEFLRYEGDQAVCEGKGGLTKLFPRSEIFDVKKVIDVATHLMLFGMWQEGQEGLVLTL